MAKAYFNPWTVYYNTTAMVNVLGNLNSIKKYLNPIVLAPVHAILVRRAFFKPVAAEQLNSGP